eukprot:scaffold100790_cov30-Tisochrysis_lutea.AAC.5
MPNASLLNSDFSSTSSYETSLEASNALSWLTLIAPMSDGDGPPCEYGVPSAPVTLPVLTEAGDQMGWRPHGAAKCTWPVPRATPSESTGTNLHTHT